MTLSLIDNLILRKELTDTLSHLLTTLWGWSGGAKVLGKLPVPGRPANSDKVGQGPIALAVGAGGGLFGHFFSRLSFLFSFSLSLGNGLI